jgi:hypothetical protein
MEFLQLASHGQVMLAMFQQNFPTLGDGVTLLLDSRRWRSPPPIDSQISCS